MSGQDPKEATILYKILTPSQYESLPKDGETRWPGVGIDLNDGFIHLSTSQQLAGTLDRFFAPSSNVGDTLYISAISLDRIRQQGYALKWEPAAGTEFGHIYSEIVPSSDFSHHHKIQRSPENGQFALPQLHF